MPASRVDRLRLLCRGPLAREREALAIRSRLDRTARTHLPQALETALERAPGAPGRSDRRVFIERLSVPIDFDVTAYDDVTLATLWAGRIRSAVEREARAREGVRVFEDDGAFVYAALVDVLERGRLSWWFEEIAAAGSLSAFELLAALKVALAAALVASVAAQPETAIRLHAALAPAERHSVALALAGVRPWSGLRSATAEERAALDGARLTAVLPRGRSPAGAPAAPGERHAEQALAEEATARAWRSTPQRPPDIVAWLALLRFAARRGLLEEHARIRGDAAVTATGHEAAHARAPRAGDVRVETHPRSASETAASEALPGAHTSDAGPAAEDQRIARTAWWTGAAGLVLLYPWLAHFLADDLPEADAHGELPAAVVARLLALGELAAPRERAMLRDPLLRLLAGVDPAHGGADPPDPPPPGHRLEAAAESVLKRFAATLPGFERSSPGYVRQHLVRRGGLVEALEAGQVRVRLEPAPLDVVLPRLPYPLTAFRLAWTPVIHIEVRNDA